MLLESLERDEELIDIPAGKHLHIGEVRYPASSDTRDGLAIRLGSYLFTSNMLSPMPEDRGVITPAQGMTARQVTLQHAEFSAEHRT